MIKLLEPIKRLEYELVKNNKEYISSQVRKLFSKRFSHIDAYINPEIRNYIAIGMQEQLIKNNLVEPINHIIIDKKHGFYQGERANTKL